MAADGYSPNHDHRDRSFPRSPPVIFGKKKRVSAKKDHENDIMYIRIDKHAITSIINNQKKKQLGMNIN